MGLYLSRYFAEFSLKDVHVIMAGENVEIYGV